MPYITRSTLQQIKLSSTILRPLHTHQPVTSYKNLRNGYWINLPPQYLIKVGNSQQCLTPPPPAHIYLKESATPKAKHNFIPVPYHYKEEVKKALWDDVKRGIGIPHWLVQYHGYYCKEKWEIKENGGLPTFKFPVQTHHTNSPFQLSMQVPWNIKKWS